MMKKLRTFIHVFINSLIPLDKYYKKLEHTPFLFSFKYFLTVMFFISILSVLSLSHFFFFVISPRQLSQAVMQTLDNFPNDLTVRIVDGHLMTNLDRPYIAWARIKNIPQPLLVIDEFAQPSKRDEYQTPVLLTENALVVSYKNTSQVMRLSPDINLRITKSEAVALKKTLGKLGVLLILIFPVLLVISMIAYFIFGTALTFFLLAIMSGVVFIIGRFKINSLNFQKVFQISLHSSTLPLLSGSGMTFFGLAVPFVFWLPFMHILFLGAALYEVYSAGPKRK